MGFYAAQDANFETRFRDRLWVAPKIPEFPEECRPNLHRGGSVKSIWKFLLHKRPYCVPPTTARIRMCNIYEGDMFATWNELLVP